MTNTNKHVPAGRPEPLKNSNADSEKEFDGTKLDSLIGRCFVIWGENSKLDRQGIVRAQLEDGYYLVQFFEILLGGLSTMAVYHVSNFKVPTPGSHRTEGTFEFFENDEHLRDWVQYVYSG